MSVFTLPQAKHARAGVLLAAALTLSLAGCGGESSEGAQASATSITVGLIPIADYAPVTYALDQGYFADEGLDVEIQPLQGGAAAVPGLLSGDLQISVTNWVSFVQAQEKGIPIQAFAPGAVARPGWSGVYAADSSRIKGAEDLAGKTVAITELKTVTELTTRVGLSEAGVDPESVEFAAVPLNTIVPAVADGTVDAGWLVEPFIGQAKSEGQRQVLDVYAGQLDGASIGGYITSRKWAAENADALAAFNAAMSRATEEMNADPTLVEQTLVAAGAMQESQTGSLMLPTFGESLSAEDVQQWADLMAEYQFVAEPVDIDEAVLDVG